MSKTHLIAVVDDDDAFRLSLVESLDSLGYSARGYASAEEFIAAEDGKSCDCIVSDIHMSGMSGFDLQLHLKSHGSRVPVILVTAHSELGLDVKATAAGAIGLLRKPFEIDVLITYVDKALSG